MSAYLGRHVPFLPMAGQPALAIDYARAREVDEATILRGTGIAADAVRADGARISAQQHLRLLANIARALDSADTAFMLGPPLLPGNDGAASLALLHAPNLGAALEVLTHHATRLSPLLRPRWRREGPLVVVYFTDSFGAGPLRGFLVEMHMAAIVAMARWLSGTHLPWRLCFNRTRPRDCAQHEVHLGPALRFDCHLDAMLIDADWLQRPWPRGNAVASAGAARQAAGEAAPPPSLLDRVYDHLLEHIRVSPTLDTTAQAFAISAATLKRHLAQHGTHFQAELDLARTHVALHLFHTRGFDNEAVAAYLGFHDATNFRRSFKRWTGLTPSSLRAGLV